jgi:hypothetical protein
MALAYPWEVYPADFIQSVRACVAGHYSAAQLDAFDEAARFNLAQLISKGATFSLDAVLEKLRGLPEDAMFYGAGNNMEMLLQAFGYAGLTFAYAIWDANAEKIGVLKGCPVSAPDFETDVRPGRIAVITLSNQVVVDLIAEKLRGCGWEILTL